MDARRIVRALKTPVTLAALAAAVVFAAQWGWNAAREPVPEPAADPCVVTEVGPTLLPEHVYVNVYNGSTKNGLAKRYGSILSADGFKVFKRVNADSSDYATSVIVGNSADSPEVQVVQQAFEPMEFRADGRIDRTVDVIIGAEQPTPKENVTFGVALPDGTACLPQLTVTVSG